MGRLGCFAARLIAKGSSRCDSLQDFLVAALLFVWHSDRKHGYPGDALAIAALCLFLNYRVRIGILLPEAH